MKHFSLALLALLAVVISTAVAEPLTATIYTTDKGITEISVTPVSSSDGIDTSAENDRLSAEEKIISGYGVGEFAVKGVIAEQVKILVAMIKTAQTDSTYKVSITVIGSADNLGTSAENDRLSKDRAEAVAAELESNFPGTKPIVAPHGNEANRRQVVVRYEFIRSAPDKNLAEINAKLDSLSTSKKENLIVRTIMAMPAWKFFGGMIVGLLFIAFLLYAALRLFSPRRKAVAPQEVPWEEGELIFLDIATKNSGTYSVKVLRKWRKIGDKKEEIFISPFKSETERDIQASHERDVIRSLKHGIEKSKFTSQLPSLIQSGKVKKLS